MYSGAGKKIFCVCRRFTRKTALCHLPRKEAGQGSWVLLTRLRGKNRQVFLCKFQATTMKSPAVTDWADLSLFFTVQPASRPVPE